MEGRAGRASRACCGTIDAIGIWRRSGSKHGSEILLLFTIAISLIKFPTNSIAKGGERERASERAQRPS